MSRFLRKKTDRWPSGARDEESLAKDVGKLVKPGSSSGSSSSSKKASKKRERSGRQDMERKTALPKLDTVEFRTSLILPGLSKRFSVLKAAPSNEMSENDLRNRLAVQRTRATSGPSLTLEEEELVLAELRLKRQGQDEWDGEPPTTTSFHSNISSTSPSTTESTSNPSLHSYYVDRSPSPPPSSNSLGSLNTFGGGSSSSVLERDRGVSRAYGLTSTSGMREAEYIRRTRKNSEAQRSVSATDSLHSLVDSDAYTDRSSSQTPVQDPSPERSETVLPFSGARVSSRTGSRPHSPSASTALAMGTLPPQQPPPVSPLPTPPLPSGEAFIPRSPRRRSLLASLTPAQIKRISAALVEIEEDIGASTRGGIARSGSNVVIQEEDDEEEEEDAEGQSLLDEAENGDHVGDEHKDVEQLHETAESSHRDSTYSFNDPSTPTASAFASHSHGHSRRSPNDPSSRMETSKPAALTPDAVARGYVPGMVRPFGSPSAESNQARQRAGSMGSQHSQTSGRMRSGSTPLPPARVSSLARSQSSSQAPSRAPTPSRGHTPTPPVSIAQLRNGNQPMGLQHQPYQFMRRPSSPFVAQAVESSSGSPEPTSVRESASSMGSVARAHIARVASPGIHIRSGSAVSQSSMRSSTASPLPALRPRESHDSLGSDFSIADQVDADWSDLLQPPKEETISMVNDVERATDLLVGSSGLSKEDLEEMQRRLVLNAKEIRDALRGPVSSELPKPGFMPRPPFRGRHVSTLPEDEDELRRAISPPPVPSPLIPSRHRHNPSQTSIQRMLRPNPGSLVEEMEPSQDGDEYQAHQQPTPELSESSRQMSIEPTTPRQDSPLAKTERTQALAQLLFGDDGKLLTPEVDSPGFVSILDLPEPPQAPVSIRDDPAVIRDYEERIAKATAMLQRTPSAKPLTRKGTKRGQTPKVISSPQLVSSTVQVPTTPLSPPSTSSRDAAEVDPAIARALEKASGTKMSARLKRFASFKRTNTSDAVVLAPSQTPVNGQSLQKGLAAPIDLHVNGPGSAPAIMDHFKFPNAAAAGSSQIQTAVANCTPLIATPQSPPLTANPQSFKSVMTRFKRNRKKSDAAPLRSESPGYGLVEPKELKTLIKSMPGQGRKPESPTSQVGKINGAPKSAGTDSRHHTVKSSADSALVQLFDAASTLGLDSHGLDQLLAKSTKESAPHAASERERRAVNAFTSDSAPPLPTSILRSASTSGTQSNVIVRRTIIIPQDNDALTLLEELQIRAPDAQRKLSIKRKPIKLNLADRELVSGDAVISHRRGSSVSSARRVDSLDTVEEDKRGQSNLRRVQRDTHDPEMLSPADPSFVSQLPASPSDQSFTSRQRSSTGGSLYDLYADYHEEVDPSASSTREERPVSLGQPGRARESQHAVEICELSDGQVVWSIVEGQNLDSQQHRDSIYSEEELQSQYAYSRPVSAVIPSGSSEPLQLYIKGHQRMTSSGRSTEAVSKRKPSQNGSERPETKVFYSSSNNVVDLIESLSRNLDQGRFDIIPDSAPGSPRIEDRPRHDNSVAAAFSGAKTSTSASMMTTSSDEPGKSKTVEQRLQALLDRMQAVPAGRL